MSKEKGYTVSVTSRKITNSWWADAWVKKIESYSDFSNRLPRAKSYLRGGKIKELFIEEGIVYAKVKGSKRRPYSVDISFKEISEDKKSEIKELFSENIDSLEDLLSGNFPIDFKDKLMDGKYSLFPEMSEIYFSCSCPDWANLCKHIGAVLYGIGVIFDDEPSLFFKLRGLDVNDLIKKSIDVKLNDFLNKKIESDRLVDDSVIKNIFGEDM